MKHMKWWGWGEEGVAFRYDDKPAFAAFIKNAIDIVKRAIQQGFIDLGGTLSHHHAVGVEHSPWLSQDISPAGVTMIRSLLDGVDPQRNFNPGKIV
jgi:alkyldihydroxyacetonephosphate synthase